MKLTKSKKFILILSSFLTGIFLSKSLGFNSLAWTFGFASLSLLAVFYRKTKLLFLILALISVFLGVGYFNYFKIDQSDNLDQTNQDLVGIVVDEPIVKDQNQTFTLKIDKAKLLITAQRFPEVFYGDELKINGQMKKPATFEDFDYAAYLQRYGVSYVMYYPKIEKIGSGKGDKLIANIYLIKNYFINALNKTTPEPESSLSAAVLVGARKSMPQNLLDDFKGAGLTHIIAISGYNITIIIAFSWLLLRSLGRRFSLLANLILISAFIILTGASSSIIRGAIVAILVLLAKFFGRRSNPTILLALAAFLMSLVNVYVLRIDAGFQLSFLSFAGLMYLSPILTKRFKSVRLPSALAGPLSETLSAQLFALPVILVLFGQISFVSIIANILILPTIPLAMAIGFTQGILGMLFLPLAKILGWFNWLILHYIIKMSAFFAHLPFSNSQYKISYIWLFLYYPILIYIIWLRTKNAKTKAS